MTALQARERADEPKPINLHHAIHRVHQIADDLWAKEAGDLTPRQYILLEAIDRGPERGKYLSQTDLVERTGIDRSTLADMARRLKKSGILVRSRTRSDARAYNVQLTSQGERALSKGRAAAAKVQARIAGRLDFREQRMLSAALERICAGGLVAS